MTRLGGLQDIGLYGKQTKESEFWRPVKMTLLLLLIAMVFMGLITTTALAIRGFGFYVFVITFLSTIKVQEGIQPNNVFNFYWRSWVFNEDKKCVHRVVFMAFLIGFLFSALELIVDRPILFQIDTQLQLLWIASPWNSFAVPLWSLWVIIPLIVVIDVVSPFIVSNLWGRLKDEIGFPNYRNSIRARSGNAGEEAPITYSESSSHDGFVGGVDATPHGPIEVPFDM